ncbi:hypothetical protein CJU89_5342 [Yarrowia sp. B02]|nr:hypothetical protein CJU89_5342 [Yarrowia sp. B02]
MEQITSEKMWAWGKPFLPVLLTWFIPKLMQTYHKIRNPPAKLRALRSPLTKTHALVILLLLVTAALQLAYAYSRHYENVVLLTGSRMQTSGSVVMSRLKKIRALAANMNPKDYQLSDREEAFFKVYQTDKGRALYTVFGPDVLADCKWCHPESQSSYFLYSIPNAVAAYVINLLVTGIATSSSISFQANSWRKTVLYISFILLTVDLLRINSQTGLENLTRPNSKVEWYFQILPVWRAQILAGMDVILGICMFLSTTGRLFHTPEPLFPRVTKWSNQLKTAGDRAKAAIMIKRSVLKHPELAAQEVDFFDKFKAKETEIASNEKIQQSRDAAIQRTNMNQARADLTAFYDNAVNM